MSAATAAAAAASLANQRAYRANKNSMSGGSDIHSYGGMNKVFLGSSNQQYYQFSRSGTTTAVKGSQYEIKKQRDWNKFDEYRKSRKPVPLTLHRCTTEHVLDFIRLMSDDDRGSLEAVIGRLRVAFVENGGKAAMNPFFASEVKLYLQKLKEASHQVVGEDQRCT